MSVYSINPHRVSNVQILNFNSIWPEIIFLFKIRESKLNGINLVLKLSEILLLTSLLTIIFKVIVILKIIFAICVLNLLCIE